MDKEIMSNLQKQFNKVNRKIQILNNEVDTLKKIKYINSAKTKAELKQSRYNQFVLMISTSTIFFILGMIAYKYLALSGVVKTPWC